MKSGPLPESRSVGHPGCVISGKMLQRHPQSHLGHDAHAECFKGNLAQNCQHLVAPVLAQQVLEPAGSPTRLG